jgi:hypothetical protein
VARFGLNGLEVGLLLASIAILMLGFGYIALHTTL